MQLMYKFVYMYCCNIYTVSYTHLDVYKRQPKHSEAVGTQLNSPLSLENLTLTTATKEVHYRRWNVTYIATFFTMINETTSY